MTRQTVAGWARYFVISTLLIGIGFHVTRLIAGVEKFQTMFTPLVDALFSIPIILGIAASVWGWPAFDLRSRARKAVVMVTIAYFAASMPLHFRTWFTWDTSYIARFPWWYSLVFLSYTSILMWVWLRLELRPEYTSK
jgi:hypothetical protein